MKIFAKLIFRVRGIPHNATLSDLRRTLCPDDPKTTIRATFSPSPYDRNRKTALVQFDPRHPEYLDIVVAGATKNHQMEMLMDQQPDFCADIVVDTEFNGLTQMYPTPPGVKINAEYDSFPYTCVGHAFGSWRGKGALGRMWLREFLAVDLPNCRTMTYGYDSKLLSKGVHEVMSYKIRLLEELRMARTSDEERNRPIIFIGHSFGGIIIEQALVHSSLATSDPALNAISASTHAIMFFGTPHRCFPVDDIIKIIDPPANAERVSLVQSINSMSGVDLERFGRFVAEARIPVISFYERLESRKDIKGDTGCERSDRNVTSVDSEPSLLNLEGVREIKVPLEVDHTGIVEFDSVEDEAYRSVRYYLQDFESEIINAEQEMKKKKEARAANPGIVAPIQPKMLNDVPVPMMMVPYKEAMQRAKDENERPKTQPKANPSATEDDLAGIFCAIKQAVNDSDMTVIKQLIIDGVDLNYPHGNDGWTPLEHAVNQSHEPMVRLLLQGGADPDYEGRAHWTPLLRAISNSHLHLASLLIKGGADPKKHHSDGWTPLQLAAYKGFEPMVLMLIERGADPDHESTSHWTPLLRAIDCGHIHIAKLLIDKGADPNKHHEDGWTPLQWAAKKGSEVMVKMLIERGADPDHESRSHWTPFLRALDSGHTGIAKLLIESGANPSKYHGDGWTPLQWAAKKGSEVMVKMLVERGANPDHESTSHWTPLLRAIDCGHIHVANLLIDKGADPNKNHQDGWTPLQWAAKKGSEVMVKMLIERGANLDSQSSTYWTPLSRAIDSNHLTVSRLLIENGADPDLHHSDGWTPLHFAARRGSEEMVKMLLEKGADPDYESSTHWAPLSRAVNHSQLHIARLLIKSGARADKHYRDGWTPMQYAARSGSEPILRLLISEAPSEVDYESPTHWTPLLRAVDNGHGHIVKFLIENGADPRRRYGDGYTPLSYAEKKGYEPMKKLLLVY